MVLPFYVLESDPPAKREILRAALKLFSQRGLAATSIRDIAAESGYTNPALYKHFASKEELALYLFETCHRRLYTRCQAAIAGARSADARLERYVGQMLTLIDEDPAAMAFLSENARVLWPKAGAAVRRQTLIALARSVMSGATHPDIAAASVQGTIAEVARMIQVGVLAGPAIRWKAPLVDLLRRARAA